MAWLVLSEILVKLAGLEHLCFLRRFYATIAYIFSILTCTKSGQGCILNIQAPKFKRKKI